MFNELVFVNWILLIMKKVMFFYYTKRTEKIISSLLNFDIIKKLR